MIEAIVLATTLSTAIFLTDSTDNGKSAVSNVAMATYRYTKLDEQLEPFVKDLEKRYVPKVIRDAGISGYFVYRLIHDNRVEYTWSF